MSKTKDLLIKFYSIIIRYRLILISFIIFFWQLDFFINQNRVNGYYQGQVQYKNTAMTGGLDYLFKDYKNFVFFIKKTGHFPVAMTSNKQNNLKLVNEVHDTMRAGGWLRVYLVYIESLFASLPSLSNYRYTNFIIFTTSLILFFVSFARVFGFCKSLALTFLLGANAFQLSESYEVGSINSEVISVVLIAIALSLNWIVSSNQKISKNDYYLLFLLGAFFGTMIHIRTEYLAILLVLVAVLLFTRRRLREKLLMAALLGTSFFIFKSAWDFHFKESMKQAQNFVKEKGDVPYPGAISVYHPFWHSIFCGLGDWGKDKGYEWNDHVAFSYGFAKLGLQPISKNNYFSNFTIGVIPVDNPSYIRTIYDLPQYTEVLRNKIINDIAYDPWWYTTIIAKRIKQLIIETSGIHFSLGPFHLEINFKYLGSILLFGALISSAYLRLWYQWRLLALGYSGASAAILVYSLQGMTYFSIAHIFAAFFLAVNTYSIAVYLTKKSPTSPPSYSP